jgi:histidinol dehydrogenase
VRHLSVTSATIPEVVAALRPSAEEREEVRRATADIVAAVRAGGDDALHRLTARLDGVAPGLIRVPRERLRGALAGTPAEVRAALELMAENVRRVAEELLPRPRSVTLPEGHVVAVRPVPVDRVGAYVPGGLGAYPSSAVMAVVPAAVAGVREIAVCSPPGEDGLPAAAVLAACELLGVSEVYAIGGAQAVAALAYGTESVRPVDMIVGPGNAYVEEAKRGLWGDVGIESLAGPSELVVLADATAPAEAVAWDLLAQCEHGAGAQSMALSPDPDVLAAIEAALPIDAPGVSLVRADSIATAMAFVNAYAPEHLQLAVEDARDLLDDVRHAGAVFLGPLSGTAFGDYVAGSNHILPTAGRARFSSGLNPGSFVRLQEVVDITPAAVAALAGPLAALAGAEGFAAHARSALVRADALGEPAPAGDAR